MFKLNNKGYMLVEIILASVIAFGVAYFIVNLTIKLKNKNDDLLVETQVKTDQAIITNKLMEYAMAEREEFKCSDIEVSNKQITYKGNTIDVVNQYTDVSYNPDKDCKNDLGKISINISLNVPQLGKKDYDAQVDYKYEIGDMIPPEINLEVIDGNVWKQSNVGKIRISDNNALKSGTYTIKYAWGTSNVACNTMSDSASITIANGESEKEIEVSISAKTGDGKLYICNGEDIEDFANNKLSAYTIKNAQMKLDNTAPTCSISVSGTTMNVSITENNSGKAYYGWNSSYSGDKTTSGTISSAGTKTYYVKDNVGLTGSCSIKLKYSDCATGSDTCTYGCDYCEYCKGMPRWNGYEHSCVMAGYTYIKGNYCNCDSCHSGSNTCKAGYLVDKS